MIKPWLLLSWYVFSYPFYWVKDIDLKVNEQGFPEELMKQKEELRKWKLQKQYNDLRKAPQKIGDILSND